MALKHLISLESGHVQYEQTGFDVYMKDNADVDGYDHVDYSILDVEFKQI